jgi:hypothetical protein
MPLSAQQPWLACTIDTHAKPVIAYGEGDEEQVLSLADHMGTFKPLMEMSTGEEIKALCQPCNSSSGSAKQLQRQGEGTADGSVPMAE